MNITYGAKLHIRMALAEFRGNGRPALIPKPYSFHSKPRTAGDTGEIADNLLDPLISHPVANKHNRQNDGQQDYK